MNWLKNKGHKCWPKTFEGSLFEEVFRGTKNENDIFIWIKNLFNPKF